MKRGETVERERQSETAKVNMRRGTEEREREKKESEKKDNEEKRNEREIMRRERGGGREGRG